MELDLGPELRSFREEIRGWVVDNVPPGLTGPADPAWEEWEGKLLEARLVCPQWPEEVGGRGWDGPRLAIFDEECHRAGVARVTRGAGESLVGPAVIVHGTAEQRARLLPGIVQGGDRYCVGFSESGHGSDLAAVETRGQVAGDELVVTGRKVWVSGADQATAILVLCRTGVETARHRNLVCALVPLHGAGVELSPLRDVTGAADCFEVSLHRARTPLRNVIGRPGGGWQVAMTALAFERGGRAAVAHLACERELWDLVETARRRGRDRDPLVRQQLAWAFAQVRIMRIQGLRLLAQLALKRQPGPEASLMQLHWAEYHRRLSEIAADIVGTDGLLRPGRWQDALVASRADTIASGTSEIQRNIIAERILGLPGEPALLDEEVVSGSARR